MTAGTATRLMFAAFLAPLSCAGNGDAVTHDTTAIGAGQPARAASTHDWTRFGWNLERSSASTDPTGIDSANVGTLTRHQVSLEGTVDATPIYLHGVTVRGSSHDVLFVTTSYGKTLAIDANDGALLWRFTPPSYDALAGTYRITNSTPVADPGREFIYAASPDGFVRKLAVADGHVAWATAITLLPAREKIASPLNFDRGHVIATTGGYIGDAPPYQGHVAILDANSGQLLHVWNSLCSDRSGLIAPESCDESDSAIWGRAGAVIDPETGNIFVATGNAPWDGARYWGDAVIELDANATHILGNYTPSNTEELNSTDGDLGSTSPVLLGPGLVAQGGKDGRIRLLDWTRMQGTTPHKGGESQIVSTPSGTDLFTAPAVLRTSTATWLFAADNGGTAAWTVNAGRLEQKWKNGNAGTSPVIAGGLLFVYDPGGGIRVYQPESGRQVTVLPTGGGHWNSPIVVDGMIIVTEGSANRHRTSGIMDIFRVPGH